MQANAQNLKSNSGGYEAAAPSCCGGGFARATALAKPGAQPSLGIIRQNVDASGAVSDELAKKIRVKRDRRRDAFADQRRAAEIYKSMTHPDDRKAGRGVTFCGWTQIATQETRLVRLEGPEKKAFYRGLHVCGLRWVCPVCTAKRSEESRQELNAALAVGRERGLVPVMVTLTARHHRKTSLADFWSKLGQAERELKKTRPWKKLNKQALEGGFAKAVEVTHSERNGWHPHFHLVMLARADDEAHAIEQVEELRAEWLHQLERVGLDGTSKAATERAFHVRGAAEAGNYVSKWGAAEELALGSTKEAKGLKGRTPWQLLRDARTADDERERQLAAALWWEFIQCFKGVHQLRQSPKFRELVAEYEPEEAGEDEPEETEIYNFGKRSDDWNQWDYGGRSKRLRLVETAEAAATPTEANGAVAVLMVSDECDADLLVDTGPDGDVIDDDWPDVGPTPEVEVSADSFGEYIGIFGGPSQCVAVTKQGRGQAPP